MQSVASLRWVTPGAATEGATPIFFLKKTDDLFYSSSSPVLRYHPYFFFCSSLSLLLISLGGCHPHLFYLSDLVCPLFFVNLPTNFFPSSVTHLKGVTRGGPPASLVTPLRAIFSKNIQNLNVCNFEHCIYYQSSLL